MSDGPRDRRPSSAPTKEDAWDAFFRVAAKVALDRAERDAVPSELTEADAIRIDRSMRIIERAMREVRREVRALQPTLGGASGRRELLAFDRAFRRTTLAHRELKNAWAYARARIG